MNKIHLAWIIPLSFIVGGLICMGFYAHIEMMNNRYMFNISMSCIQELYNISIYP